MNLANYRLALIFLMILTIAPVWLAAQNDISVTDGTAADWFDMMGLEFCVNDEGGINDQTSPAVDDITVFCISPDAMNNTFYINFGFDDVAIMGANDSAACILVEAPDMMGGFDGTFDFAICAVIIDSPTVVEEVVLYSCSGSSVGCGSAAPIKTYTEVVMGMGDYALVNDEDGIFDAPAADSYVEVCVPFADLGVTTADIVLSSLISYPDNNTLTAPKDTVFADPNDRLKCDLGTGVCAVSGPTATAIP